LTATEATPILAPMGIGGPRRRAAGGRWLLAVLPGAKLLLHLVTIRGYGFFRDEFYYVACSERLAAGYVDHPPLSVVLLRLVRELLGDSIVALRLVPALAGAATVLLVGLLARDLGGGRFAQGLAMTSALVAPVYLSLNHFYSMNAVDLLLWATAAYLVVRLLRGGRPRLWLALGVVLGLGLQNKLSVLWLSFGLLAGIACTSRRRDLLTRWPSSAALVAGVLFLPHLAWQVAHGWPTLEFIRNATQQKMATVTPVGFLISQLRMMNFVTAPVWASDLV
jgi:4-amino-4-deoxy-L-arabinose transferase-like glycosyltransferase